MIGFPGGSPPQLDLVEMLITAGVLLPLVLSGIYVTKSIIGVAWRIKRRAQIDEETELNRQMEGRIFRDKPGELQRLSERKFP